MEQILEALAHHFQFAIGRVLSLFEKPMQHDDASAEQKAVERTTSPRAATRSQLEQAIPKRTRVAQAARCPRRKCRLFHDAVQGAGSEVVDRLSWHSQAAWCRPMLELAMATSCRHLIPITSDQQFQYFADFHAFS